MSVVVRSAGKGDIALVLNLWAVGGENASRPDDVQRPSRLFLAETPRP